MKESGLAGNFPTMETLGSRIRQAREAMGMTQTAFAEWLGFVTRGAVGNWERDQGISREHFQLVVNKLRQVQPQMSPEWLAIGEGTCFYVLDSPSNKAPGVVGGQNSPLTYAPGRLGRSIRVAGEVQAGSWREAMDDGGLGEDVNVLIDPRYAHMNVTALKVRGPSMDRKIPDGSYVLCVSFIDLDRQPVSGEFVVVQRRKANGLTEATVKQYVVEDGQAKLWPRSHDPRYQEPLILNGSHDDEEIVITALAFQMWQPL